MHPPVRAPCCTPHWPRWRSATASFSLVVGALAQNITVGELIFWPSSYSAIHRIAPARSKSLMMGIWLATLGLGQYITHQVGRTAERIGFSVLSSYIGMAMLAACIAVIVIARARPTLRSL